MRPAELYEWVDLALQLRELDERAFDAALAELRATVERLPRRRAKHRPG
jgi:hypothetical protein